MTEASKKRTSYRDTASFGKRQEYIVIAELLKRGFDVYQTLVDDQGIDCIIRRDVNGELSYIDVQIKARSRQAGERSHGHWPAIRIQRRENYFFIFFSEPLRRYWIIPSVDLADKAKLRKGTEDVYDVFLANLRKPRGVKKAEHVESEDFEQYINAWELLRPCGSELS